MLSITELRERGWTLGLIGTFLGEPDLLKRNPYYAKAAPMRLYALARVETAEQSADFVSACTDAGRRVNGAMKANATKRAKLLRRIADKELQWVAEMEVIVKTHPIEKVRRLAIEAYNDRLLDTERFEAEPASETSNPEFLERIMVNFIRHRLATYDESLAEVAGFVGVRDAVRMIRLKVLAAIAAAYPELARECDRQQAVRS